MSSTKAKKALRANKKPKARVAAKKTKKAAAATPAIGTTDHDYEDNDELLIDRPLYVRPRSAK